MSRLSAPSLFQVSFTSRQGDPLNWPSTSPIFRRVLRFPNLYFHARKSLLETSEGHSVRLTRATGPIHIYKYFYIRAKQLSVQFRYGCIVGVEWPATKCLLLKARLHLTSLTSSRMTQNMLQHHLFKIIMKFKKNYTRNFGWR